MKSFLFSCLFLFISLIANAQYASSNNKQDLPGTLSTKFGGQLYCNGVLVKPGFAQTFMTENQYEAYMACEDKVKTINKNLNTALYIEGGSLILALVAALTGQYVVYYATGLGELAAAGFFICGLVQAGSNQSRMEELISDITYGTNRMASLSFGPTNHGIGIALNF